jgi:hypothetical protein
MTKFVVITLAAVTLMQSAFAVAGESTDSHPKPSSFVPHPHTKNHVYGAPIHPAIVGHSSVSRHKHTPKKQSLSAAKRNSK